MDNERKKTKLEMDLKDFYIHDKSKRIPIYNMELAMDFNNKIA